jgi:uncharacterized protein YjdB
MSTRAFILAVTGFATCVVAACSTYGTSTVEVKSEARVASIFVALGSSTLVAGQTQRATATVKDATGAILRGRAVTWSTSSTSIAIADDSGVIVAVAPGSTVVRAESEGVSGQSTLTVSARPPAPVANISVAISPSAVVIGQVAHASASVKDSAGNVLSDRTITWQSANANVAVVSATGDVSAVGSGTTSISATSEGQTAAATFAVSAPAPVPVASVSVSPATSNLQVGGTASLTATERDASGNVLTGRVVGWTSSNASVASVSSSGVVTAVASGSATITASSEGINGTASVNVAAPAPVPVATVSVSPAAPSLTVGGTVQLSATTRDASNNVLTGRVVTWSTANANIASVNSSGVVTAVAAGSTQVTATSEGKSGSATITVSAPAPVPVATVSVSPSSSSVQVGATIQLSATTRDANNNVLSGRVISWSTGDASIATVNANSGLVTGVAAGTVQITATSEGKTGSSTITVAAAPPPPPPGSSNEPSGMTVIAERAFNTLQESPWDTDNSLSIVQDATAPKSPSSVIRVTFPTGFAGGSSNGHTGMQWSGGQRILYISYWMKYSTNWWGHNTGINKQAYAWVDEGGGYTPFVMEAEGVGSGPLIPRPILQRMIKGDGNYEPNLVSNSSATIQRGQWFHIEAVLTGNTSGTANGAMDIYLDGTHVTSVSGLQWTNGTTSWFIFELYPVWGGIGDVVPATMTADWDHVYLSGK